MIIVVVAAQICGSKMTFAQQVDAVCRAIVITSRGTTTIIVQQLIEFTWFHDVHLYASSFSLSPSLSLT